MVNFSWFAPCHCIVITLSLYNIGEINFEVLLNEFLYIGYLCYNDGCHLWKYAQNSSRSQATQIAQHMAKLSIVIDSMHMKGHTDSWCKRNCDPKWFPQLNNVSVNMSLV